MSERDDGGPAFPTEPRYNSETTDAGFRQHFYAGHYGMTLRDWFAGMALQGIRAREGFAPDCSEVAKYAYMQADAMLKARK